MTSIITADLQSALSALQTAIKSAEAKAADVASGLNTLHAAEASIKDVAAGAGTILADIEGWMINETKAVEADIGLGQAAVTAPPEVPAAIPQQDAAADPQPAAPAP